MSSIKINMQKYATSFTKKPTSHLNSLFMGCSIEPGSTVQYFSSVIHLLTENSLKKLNMNAVGFVLMGHFAIANTVLARI